MNIEQHNPLLPASVRGTRARVLLYVASGGAMLMAGAIMWPRSLTDWDSWDYAMLAMTRQPSGLCLRRWWFVYLMRSAWQVGGVFGFEGYLEAFQPMKAAVLLASAGAVTALVGWTYRLTGHVRTAAVAAVIGLASPSLLLYCGTVMTEGPTLLVLALTMICWELAIWSVRLGRSYAWAAAAGLLFGVAVNMREPALFLGAWPIVSCFVDRPRQRWGLLAAAMAGAGASLGFGVAMAWQWSGVTPAAILGGYKEYMHGERTIYGFNGWANLGYLAVHMLLASPLAGFTLLAVGATALVRLVRRIGRATGERVGARRRRSKGGPGRRLVWLGVSTLPYAGMTWYNPNLVFNYRLLLPLAWMLIPVAAYVLERALGRATSRLRLTGRTAGVVGAAMLLGGAGLVMTIAWQVMMVRAVAFNNLQDLIYRRLQDLPPNAVIIPGPGSTSAEYLRIVGGRKNWHVVTTDFVRFDWSVAGISRQLEEHMAEGQQAFVNANPAGWSRPGSKPWEWNNLREVLTHYETREVDDHFVELIRRRD